MEIKCNFTLTMALTILSLQSFSEANQPIAIGSVRFNSDIIDVVYDCKVKVNGGRSPPTNYYGMRLNEFRMYSEDSDHFKRCIPVPRKELEMNISKKTRFNP